MCVQGSGDGTSGKVDLQTSDITKKCSSTKYNEQNNHVEAF